MNSYIPDAHCRFSFFVWRRFKKGFGAHCGSLGILAAIIPFPLLLWGLLTEAEHQEKGAQGYSGPGPDLNPKNPKPLNPKP